MDDKTKLEIEAAAFRSLKAHLMEKRTDVQNIDLMNLAGFWYHLARQFLFLVLFCRPLFSPAGWIVSILSRTLN